MSNQLFDGTKLSEYLDGAKKAALMDADKVTGPELAGNTIDQIVTQILSAHEVEAAHYSGTPTKRDAQEWRYSDKTQPSGKGSGLQQEVSVPFTGNRLLFYFQPRESSVKPVLGVVSRDCIIINYRQRVPNEEKLNQCHKENMKLIQEHLDTANEQVEEFNKSLRNVVDDAVRNRKKRLDEIKETGEALQIERRPDTEVPPVVLPRRRASRSMIVPPVAARKKPDGYHLQEENYELILETLQDMSVTMERSPQAFTEVDEETIRFWLLVTLNAVFKGEATGETFNGSGKTDILIRHKGANIFIAECKIWRGKAQFMETIDQVLGYTTWRDTKTAILLFNRNQNFTSVLEQISSIGKEHSCCIQQLESRHDTQFRFRFHLLSDSAREITLTVLAFDLAVPPRDG